MIRHCTPRSVLCLVRGFVHPDHAVHVAITSVVTARNAYYSTAISQPGKVEGSKLAPRQRDALRERTGGPRPRRSDPSSDGRVAAS